MITFVVERSCWLINRCQGCPYRFIASSVLDVTEDLFGSEALKRVELHGTIWEERKLQ